MAAKIRRVDGIRAFYAGVAARAAGRQMTAAPYDASSTEPDEQWRLQAWLRGYHHRKA
jgi:hypothetical protein